MRQRPAHQPLGTHMCTTARGLANESRGPAARAPHCVTACKVRRGAGAKATRTRLPDDERHERCGADGEVSRGPRHAVDERAHEPRVPAAVQRASRGAGWSARGQRVWRGLCYTRELRPERTRTRRRSAARPNTWHVCKRAACGWPRARCECPVGGGVERGPLIPWVHRATDHARGGAGKGRAAAATGAHARCATQPKQARGRCTHRPNSGGSRRLCVVRARAAKHNQGGAPTQPQGAASVGRATHPPTHPPAPAKLFVVVTFTARRQHGRAHCPRPGTG